MTQFIIRYRWLIIGISVILGISFGILIPFAKTDPEIRNYVPAEMNSRVETDKIESEFGVQDMVVIIFSDSSVITEENLKQIKAIDRDISRLKGISEHLSPFTISGIKGEDGMMVAEKLIDRIPSDSSETRLLKERILNNRFARDIVISSDMTTASITATIDNNISENETLERIDSVINAHPGSTVIAKGGLPYIRRYIMEDVRIDGLILVPSALLIMLLILKLTLGKWKSVMMPFSVVLISTFISMGMIPLLGWKLSIMTLLVPIILVGVANNYGIYLVARYQEIKNQQTDISKYSMISELMGSLNMPILFSGLTTIAGILGLLTHSVIPARQVGVLAATGVTIALILSLLLIPGLIYLRLSKDKVVVEATKVEGRLFNSFLSRLSGFIISHPGKILITSALVTAFLSTGIVLLRTDTNTENYFPGKHPVRVASNLINSKFGGSQTISIMLTGDIKSPEVLKGIDKITVSMENQNGVGNVFSISQVVREMSKAIYDKEEPGYDAIPDSREAIAQMFELYNMSGNPEDFKQIMNTDNTKAHILLRLSEPDNSTITAVQKQLTLLTNDFPAEVTIGGYAIIMADFAVSIIDGQVKSLLFALFTVFILLAIIFKSINGGLIGSIPLAASILILFGFMGVSEIALDGATALLSSIMIGVGVDFTIQYVWCFNSYFRKGVSHTDATTAAINTIGRSIIINAVSVMAGFSVLMLSGFTSIRFFGYLVLISIGACLIGAILIIPAFILVFRPKFIGKEFIKLNKEKDENKTNCAIASGSNIPGSSTRA
jgi:predicted RND superfamily exporter protein